MIQRGTNWRIAVATSLFTISLTSVTIMLGCHDAATVPKPLTPVRTGEVQSIDAGTSNTYSANIQPYQQVDLAFKSNGYLASVRQVKDANGRVRNIDQGDWVTKGTVLATVDQGDYKEKLQQADAQLPERRRIMTAPSCRWTALLCCTRTERQPSRTTTTPLRRFSIPRPPFKAPRPASPKRKIALAYCQLRAPFDGWVVKRNVDVGQLVGPRHQWFHHRGCALGESRVRRSRHCDGTH